MLPFPIVDTHLHIWDVEKLPYAWLGGVPALNRSFQLDDYHAATAGVEIEQMVFVQCEVDQAHFLAEAQWVSAQARIDPRISAIVPWAPLEKGAAAAADLDQLIDLPNVRGIRRIIQFEPDMEFCLKPDFVAAVRLLARYGLTFDICIDHRHMENTIAFARQCPDVPMVLDHIGKPAIAAGEMEPWSSQMAELAKMENVWLKMSGVATEANHASWTREQLRPYILTALEAFGPSRTMFGGDWPVSTQAIGYPDWIETLLWSLDGASDADLRAIFSDTAKTFYGLS